MQIHQIQRQTKLAKKKIIGRGGKRGTTAGRGTKGQKARAGHRIRPEIRDTIKKIPKLLKELSAANKYVIITDKNIEKLYGEKLYKMLKYNGFNVEIISIPPGEKSKSEYIKTKICDMMLRKKCGRDTMILALGGGVVGDVAGFVAAIYMRGIPYIQIPTSFLAMVDSSIGGKVGVDTKYGKNLIGAFWQPQAVIMDTDFLENLPITHLRNGLFEAVKIFITSDSASLGYIQKNLSKFFEGDRKVLQNVLIRAVKLKVAIVERDEKEGNERSILNFGHTIGHALELKSSYKLLHGFGVGAGIIVESKISELLGILSSKDYKFIKNFILKLLPPKNILQKFSTASILKATRSDKKSAKGRVKYILLKKIGEVYKTKGKFSHEVDDKLVKKAINSL